MLPGVDYDARDNVDLPHTLKSQGIDAVRAAFRRWIAQGKRSDACVGAWARPLFAGGWSESTGVDTAVYVHAHNEICTCTRAQFDTFKDALGVKG